MTPNTEDYDPTDLPPALSENERVSLRVTDPRALALIDALTEHLAEAVARLTVAETERDDLSVAFNDSHTRELVAEGAEHAALTRAEAAEARVRALEAERDQAQASARHFADVCEVWREQLLYLKDRIDSFETVRGGITSKGGAA